jgi:hypothetical protein
MSQTTLTAVLGILVALFGGVTVPLWLARRSDRASAMAASKAAANVTMNDLNNALAKQNTSLEAKLRDQQAEHERQMATLRAKYDADLGQANGRIRELERTVIDLQADALRYRSRPDAT